MPVALIIVGVMLGMAAVNDKLGALGALAKGDLFGSGGQDRGFIVWAAAIIITAAIMRMLDMPEAGKMLVLLVVLAYLLGHANIPGQLSSAIEGAGGAGPPTAPPAPGAQQSSK